MEVAGVKQKHNRKQAIEFSIGLPFCFENLSQIVIQIYILPRMQLSRLIA